jgi:soluble lytic murein transglycosylase-like protein
VSNAVGRFHPEWSQDSAGGGCCSNYVLLPIIVIIVVTGLATLALRNPVAAVAAPPLAPAESALSPIFTPEVQYWGPSILRWSAEWGLDPNLAATVMQIESCGDPFARSRSGALGLFQVMPFHFDAIDDPVAPDVNAARGLAYLKRALDAAGGDARLALAGYNGGLSVITRPFATWSDETLRYVRWGAGIYGAASGGASHSDMLDDWFATAGSGLCRRARERLPIGG